jgi:predicted extracellular nuclease
LNVHVFSRSRVIVALLMAGALLIAFFAETQTARAASSSVVINEVYGGGGNSGATYTNDFIELTNFSATPVDLTGYSVQYASATGTSYQVTPLSGTITPGEDYLIQESAGAAGTTALPTPQATGTINLSATAGKVALVSNTTALSGAGATTGTPTGPGLIDYVGYGTTANQFEGTGPAPAPANTTSVQRNSSVDTDQNATDFSVGSPTPGATNNVSASGGSGGGGTTATAGPVKIDQIQGNGMTSSGWLSPYDGQTVTNVPGIVTGIRTSGDSKGFWFQDPNPDNDPATSEGLFVYTSSVPSGVSVGDSVLVSGSISNYDPEGNRATTTTSDLDVTELGDPTTTVLSHNNPLPAPIVIGPDTVPSLYAPDLGNGNIESGAIMPTRSALDYYRSIEGMRVEVDNARVVGPSGVFGSGTTLDSESYVTTKPNEAVTFRGGTELLGENQMPAGLLEVVPDDGSNPGVSVGDVLTGATVGTIDYSEFGGYEIAATQVGTVSRTNEVTPTVVPPAPTGQLSIATYNVENLSPTDPASKFAALGQDLVTNLGTPDIVAVEEIQDNDGATDDGVVAANQTISELTTAISNAGGPSYSSQEIDPVNDQDGGEPGGNIRVVYLYNPAAVTFVPGTQQATTSTAALSTTATAVSSVAGQPVLTLSPGRIDPTNAAWNSSRKPLVGEFLFQGKPVFLIANHFVAKLGDQDQDGRFQYPVQSSAAQRAQQAAEVHDFTQQILNINPNANVVVLGDLNDYQFSPALKTLETGNADGSGTAILQDLITTLPLNEQYTYDYEGVSEVLDHILVSPALEGQTTYQVVHINSEFSPQVSDHDPQVVDLTLPTGVSYNETLGAQLSHSAISLPASYGDARHPLRSLFISPTFAAGVTQVTYTLNRRVVCHVTRAPFSCRVKLTGADPGLAKLTIAATLSDRKVSTLVRIIHITRIAPRHLTLISRRVNGQLRLSGKLALPANVTAAQGCEAGHVRLSHGRRSVEVKITRRCTYVARLSGVTRGARLTARFTGNRALVPATTTGRSA